MANSVLWLMFNFQGNSVWHGKWSLVPKGKNKPYSTLGQNQTKPYSFNEDWLKALAQKIVVKIDLFKKRVIQETQIIILFFIIIDLISFASVSFTEAILHSNALTTATNYSISSQ